MVAVVAEWGHSGRHSDRTMDTIGRPKEAQWWYKGGRSIAQINTQCLQQCELFYGATNGRPLCILSATTAMRVPSSSLLSATVGVWPPRQPLCACFEHAQNFTATMASMARSKRPLCRPGTIKLTFLPPLCLQRRPDQCCGRTREAQRMQPRCKGGINSVSGNHIKMGKDSDLTI